ncbi:MAG: ABC transporter ATP-binding protein [Desulfobulbaceae bacterium]|nr:ABC transporter ATP-binding protein [Desulfobulbaceae bacterium]
MLSIDGVGKSYRTYSSEFRRFAGWFGMGSHSFEENWIIRNVTFDVQRGESIGIIGRNGAGKSTLLKIITGTLAASEGIVVKSGRINAILELGMGFNPELSGRQNVMYACGLMGYHLDEILAAMPEIEAFAEIGDYFDKPIRSYSSGMQMRLAFSVATSFRPDVIIIDEALSVGDAYFQHKSFDRIRQFQNQGTTLLFVSHDRGAIIALCNRVLLIDNGSIIKDGAPEEVMDLYNALIAESEQSTISQTPLDDHHTQTVSGTGEVVFEDIVLLDRSRRSIDSVEVGEEVTLRLVAHSLKAVPELVLGYMIKDRLGQTMFGTNTHHSEQVLVDVEADQKIVYDFTFPANLGTGSYSITVAAHKGHAHIQTNYQWRDLALIFDVVNGSRSEFVGCNWLEPRISIEKQ